MIKTSFLLASTCYAQRAIWQEHKQWESEATPRDNGQKLASKEFVSPTALGSSSMNFVSDEYVDNRVNQMKFLPKWFSLQWISKGFRNIRSSKQTIGTFTEWVDSWHWINIESNHLQSWFVDQYQNEQSISADDDKHWQEADEHGC